MSWRLIGGFLACLIFFGGVEAKVPVAGLVGLSPWWFSFNDPKINDLTKTLLDQNLDIKTAQFRVTEAQSNANAQGVLGLPDMSLFAQTSRGNRNSLQDASISQIGVQGVWNLDFFGTSGNQVKSALAQVDYATAQLETVQKSMVTSLVRVVLSWQQSMLLLDQVYDQQRLVTKQLDLSDTLVKSGLATTAQHNALLSAKDQLQTQVYTLQITKQSARFHMMRLLGDSTGVVDRILAGGPLSLATLPSFETTTTVTTESLKNNATIKAAHAQFVAVNYQLKKAEADLWPSVNLNGFYAQQETSAGVFQSSPTSWNTGAGITFPLFNFGRLSNLVDAADAKSQQALLSYQNAILMTLESANSALMSYTLLVNSDQTLSRIVTQKQDDEALSKSQFESGLINDIQYSQAQLDRSQAMFRWIQARFQAADGYCVLQSTLY